MKQDLDTLSRRFDTAWLAIMQNMGPEMIKHAQLGLTPGQVFMLYFVQQEKRCSVSKLAEIMEVAPSAITVMLDRLENHGFVARTRDQSDRRVVLIELTDAGQEKLNQVLVIRKHIVQHCLSQIPANELDAFVGTLEKLASIAQAMDLKEIIAANEEA